jgi:hypothetical protein
MRFDLTVTYDDGTTAQVSAGQREMARWEAEDFGCSSLSAMDVKPMTFMQYLAWSALKRAGEVKVPFAKWADTVEEVSDEEDTTPPDPTSPGQSAEG